MAKRKTSQQRQALHLLNEARDLVRGQPRDAIQTAIDLIEDRGDTPLTSLHYDQLQPGASLVCPRHTGLVMRHGRRGGKTWYFRTTDPQTMRQVHICIGPYPEVPIAHAREVRTELASQRRSGQLPVLKTSGGDTTKTVADLADWYLETYCQTKREKSERSSSAASYRRTGPCSCLTGASR